MMTYNYFDIEKLKTIDAETTYESWLDSFNMPRSKDWINQLSNHFRQNHAFDESRLKEVFNANTHLAYKLYIIYIQEKNHPYTQNFHQTIAQSTLINFLETIQNCNNGSNERLNSIIASFYFSANNIKSHIQAYRSSLIEIVVSQFFKQIPPVPGMEVHIKAAFQRAANQILGFNIVAPAENCHNGFTDQQLNFLIEQLAKINSPFKLLEHIESQFTLPNLSKGYDVNKVQDFQTLLNNCLMLKEDKKVDLFELFFVNASTGIWEVNKKYLRQVICQKLCELGIFNEQLIFKDGQYILPKPDVKNETEFNDWLNYFATEEEKCQHSKLILLLSSARNGNIDDVLRLLDENVDINTQDKYGYTALIWAAENGHTEIVKKLLAKGASVNFQDQSSNTALIGASEKGHTEIVSQLLDNGADVNSKNQNGNTALDFAAQNGHTEIVSELLAKGANVNLNGQFGANALRLAAQNGHTEIVSQLLANGADVNSKNQNGNTALHFAAYYGHNEIVKQLLEAGADVNLQSQSGNTALNFAAQNGHTEIVKQLLEAGAMVNFQDQSGNTALHFAAYHDHNEIVKQLLEAGAGVNLQSQSGNTALICAAQKGHTEIVIQLLEAGAMVNFQDQSGNTALYFAAYHDHNEIVKQLLEAGAGVNLQSQSGNTALICAAQKGHTEIVKQLLEAGAEVNLQKKCGTNALHLAAEKGHTQIISELLAKGADINIKKNDGNTVENPFKNDPLMQQLFYTLKFHSNNQYKIAIRELIHQMNMSPKNKLQILKTFNDNNPYQWHLTKTIFAMIFLPFMILKHICFFVSDCYHGYPALKMLLMSCSQRTVVKMIHDLEASEKAPASSPCQ